MIAGIQPSVLTGTQALSLCICFEIEEHGANSKLIKATSQNNILSSMPF